MVEGLGPAEDEERPLSEHLAEIRRRLAVTLAFVLAGAALSLPFSDRGLSAVVAAASAGGARVAVYSPIEYVVVKVYLMLAAGIAVGIPVIVYETYAFVAPGLYPREKRFFLMTVPISSVLLSAGAALSWFVVVPSLVPALLSAGGDVVTVAISLERAFLFVVGTMLLMGLVFQVPLVVGLAIWSGLAEPRDLLEKRLYIYAAFFFLSSFVTLDPTFVSQLVLVVVFVALYEASVRVAAALT